MMRKPLLTRMGILVPMLILTVVPVRLETGQTGSQVQKGMSYATWWSGNYSHPDADLALANLADTGADWIGLIVTQYQDTVSSTDIYSTTATPKDTDLIHVIEKAHDLGLKVMLKPHLDLADYSTHWRGQIGHGFTEAEWTAWFGSYRGFVDHYAELAQTSGVDQFCVGTELSAAESRDADWRDVIASVRGLYSGPLTYSANHGGETDVTWWDAVDYIGVSAYYSLTSENDPTLDELKAAWEPHVATLETLAATWNRPVIFTEIGYRSLDGANQSPWDWQVEGPLDLQEQADTYQALFESVFDQSWFAGMYWWHWQTDPFQGGPCDHGYTPYDKPAEDVLRSWYGAPPRDDRPTPQPDYDRTLSIYADGLRPGWDNWSWDADVDFAASDTVYSGTLAVSVGAQPWGALSLYHTTFDSAPYHWLEFYLRKSSAASQLKVLVNDETRSELRYRPVDDCRYADEEPIEPGVWTRVRIPLSHLDASGGLIQRVSIKNCSCEPSLFLVDEIRLVGAATHNEYTLGVTIDGEGDVHVDPHRATYHYGDDVTLTATPESGWFFAEWTGDVDSIENPLLLTIQGDTELTATFCYWPDVNCDGKVDIHDVQAVADAWGCALGDDCYDPRLDVDNDGIITVIDIMMVASRWGWPDS